MLLPRTRLTALWLALLLFATIIALACTAASPAFAQRPVEVPRYTYAATTTFNAAGTPRWFPPASTIQLVTGDDDVTPQVPIGFAFTFFGRTYVNATVSTNGNVQFETTSSDTVGSLGSTADTTDIIATIAAYWTDLYSGPDVGGGNITAATLGSAPNRVFVVRFDQVPYYGETSSNVTFDVELYETTNVVQVRYFSMYPRYTDLRDTTIGICGSIHGDLTIDVLNIVNVQALNMSVIAEHNNSVLTFTPPATPTPYVTTAPPPARATSGAFGANVLRSSTPLTLPNLPNATVAVNGSGGGVTPRPPPSRPDSIIAFVTSPSTATILPLGMNFTLYGVSYSTVALFATTGVLQFVASPTVEISVGTTLPINSTDAVQPLLAFALTYWTFAGPGNVTYATTYDATNGRVFRLRYNAVPHAYMDQTMTCEVALYERNSVIEVRYLSMPLEAAMLTVGMQSTRVNVNATSAEQQYDYTVVVNNQMMLDSIADYLTNTVVQFANCSVVTCGDVSTGTGTGSGSSTGSQSAAVTSDAARTLRSSWMRVSAVFALALLIVSFLA